MNQTQDIVTGIVYTKNKQRAVISNGPDGPLGDSVIVNGLIYGDTDFNKPAIGVFDLSAVTTSVGEKRERRDVSVELSFNKSFARRSWISKLRPAFKASKQADAINLSGIESYPVGGGILDEPLTLGVTTGTGRFIGTEGTVTIHYDPTNALFTYAFTLV